MRFSGSTGTGLVGFLKGIKAEFGIVGVLIVAADQTTARLLSSNTDNNKAAVRDYVHAGGRKMLSYLQFCRDTTRTLLVSNPASTALS